MADELEKDHGVDLILRLCEGTSTTLEVISQGLGFLFQSQFERKDVAPGMIDLFQKASLFAKFIKKYLSND